MKTILILLIIFSLLAFLQFMAGFILWPLPVVLYLFVKSKNYAKVYGAAFFLGISVDLVTGQTIGVTSLLLLFFALSLFLAEKKFRSDLKVGILFGIVVQILYMYLYYA